MTWQEALQNSENPQPSSIIDLRHGFDRVFVSSLASQLYCEIKIDFDVIYKPEPSPQQQLGTEIHDALIPVEPVPIETIIKDIESKLELVTIFPVYFEYNGVLITGITDGVVFRQGKPRYLFEIKTTKGRIDKVWPGERLQSQLYALALDYMGFDLSNLEIIIPKVKQQVNKTALVKEMLNSLDNPEQSTLMSDYPIQLHRFRFTANRKKSTKQSLDELITFWKDQRQAKPSGSVAKCRPCPYKTECNYYQSVNYHQTD